MTLQYGVVWGSSTMTECANTRTQMTITIPKTLIAFVSFGTSSIPPGSQRKLLKGNWILDSRLLGLLDIMQKKLDRWDFVFTTMLAVATSYLLNDKPELGISKILIVDWDVNHGNGTQKTFYYDPRVLFFPVHRHEFGSFYPGGDDGSYFIIGEGPGSGYNINVPWENGRCGDAYYLAVWDHILIHVVKEFNPEMIIISAGFDAVDGVCGRENCHGT